MTLRPLPNSLSQSMPVQFYNSLADEKQPFEPADPARVKIYSCGPTVYNYNHLGNFRAYVFVDLLRRYLLFRGYGLEQTMNITDVEDKIIKGALDAGRSIDEFTKPYIDAFLEDLAFLNIQDLEHRPRATRSIDAMIDIMQRLDENGHVYTRDGNVYFRLKTFTDYGRLSKIEAEQLQTAADGRFEADEYTKEDVRDFALWKAPQLDNEPAWDSPFGPGRPGWHLECSAMIRDVYGQAGVDIHTGGIDLLFPHHENELAQSACAYPGDNFVRYWMHNEHLLVDGKKMSKSERNYFLLRDFSDNERLQALVNDGIAPDFLLKLKERGRLGVCLRHLLIGTHYRQKLNFTFTGIQAADAALGRIQNMIARLKEESGWSAADIRRAGEDHAAKERERGPGAEPLFPNEDSPTSAAEQAHAAFTAALDDDLNVARAFAALFDLARESTRNLEGLGTAFAERALIFLHQADAVLGILDFSEQADAAPGIDAVDADRIERLIQERKDARANKDFALADRIRDELKDEGIILKDSPEGTTWEVE